MPLYTAARNEAANGIVIDEISLHNGDPGTGAANELAAGIYSRKPIGFSAAANGVRNQLADVICDVPPGSVVSHYVLWGNGVPKFKDAFAQAETYAGQGQHKIKAGVISIPA